MNGVLPHGATYTQSQSRPYAVSIRPIRRRRLSSANQSRPINSVVVMIRRIARNGTVVSIFRIPVYYPPLFLPNRKQIDRSPRVNILWASLWVARGDLINFSCPLSYTLPRFFLTRTLRNYSHKHPSTHNTGAGLNSRVSLHREIKDRAGFRRLKRRAGAVPEMVHAQKDVWVLVEPPTYNHAHLGSKVR